MPPNDDGAAALATDAGAPAHGGFAAWPALAGLLGAVAMVALAGHAMAAGAGQPEVHMALLVAGTAMPLGLGLLGWMQRRQASELQRQRRQLLALTHSAEQLRLAQQVAQLGSFDWNLSTGMLHWSDEHFRLWGHPPGALVPDYAAFRQRVHPDDLAGLEAQLQQALRTGGHCDCEHRVCWPDGTVREIHVRGNVSLDAAGKAVRMIGTVQDITERRSTEARLHTHQSVLNTITDPVSVIDEHGVYLLVNQAWCTQAGRTPDQVIGQPAGAVPRWGVSPGHDAALQRCIEQQQVEVVLAELPLAGDGARWWETTMFPFTEPRTGRRGASIVSRDVTARQAAAQALAVSVENLRLTLNATGDAIFASDATSPTEPLLFVNDRMLQLWNIPPERAAGLSPAGVMAAARPYFVDVPREFARVAEVVGGNTVEEDRITLNDGRVLLRRCIPAQQAGRQVRVWGFRDITVEARALADLRAAKDEAERANRAMTAFLSQMSHELRTPMNSVLGFAQLLVSDTDPPLAPRQQDQVHEILRGGHHLLALINDLLDLARIEADSLRMQLQPVDVDELLADCVALVGPTAQRRGIALVLPPQTGQAWAMADSTRLRQVMLNLLGNAIKYNREGGWVRLSCQREGDRLRLTVADNGPGIDAALQPRLFRQFDRLSAEGGPVEGAGLGLALSQRLLAMMHGEIGLDSAPGQGCRFWVSLPTAEPAPPATAVPPPAAAAGPASAARGATQRVLYIEDNPVNTMLMAALFERLPDLALQCAEDARAGLAQALADPPGLVLVDIQMPGLDGYEVLRRLRAEPATRQLPVIAVSANAMAKDVARSLAAGFADHLTKPLELPRLVTAVREALARRLTTR